MKLKLIALLMLLSAPVFAQDKVLTFELKPLADTTSVYAMYVRADGLVAFDSLKIIRSGLGNERIAGYYNDPNLKEEIKFFDNKAFVGRILQVWKRN